MPLAHGARANPKRRPATAKRQERGCPLGMQALAQSAKPAPDGDCRRSAYIETTQPMTESTLILTLAIAHHGGLDRK